MPPNSYTESDLHFEFPKNWAVRAYDDHRFYKRMSGLGLKGVDFLLIDPADDGHLFLVEVKNFRTRVRAGEHFIARVKPADELAATVFTKYEHTQRAIRAVQVYYRRKWWFRLLNKWILRSHQLRYDLVFWMRAYALAKEPSRHTLVLVLETEHHDSTYRTDLQQSLSARMTSPTKVLVGEKNTFNR